MHALPTLAEIPAATESRDHARLLRIGLIPIEDHSVRAAAIALFMTDERDGNTPCPGSSGNFDAYKRQLVELSNHPARSPGGLAWKLAMVLDYFSEEEEWAWWRYLLSSAVADAIELERLRMATRADGGDMAEQLGRRWQAARDRFEATPEVLYADGNQEAREAAEEVRDQFCQDWVAIERLMIDTPATTLAGIAAKSRMVCENIIAGHTPDRRNQRLTESIIADLERMQPAQAYAQAIAAE